MEAPVMAQARMPEAFFEIAAHHLPPEQAVGPAGGRPPTSHRIVLNVLWFVLATGCRWEDIPPELGCSGMTAHRYLRRWEEQGVWDRLHADLLRLLRQAGKLDPDLVIVDAVILRAFGGGELTGPSPVDRGKRQQAHPAGGPARGAFGHPDGGGQRQRPHPDHPGGARLPQG